jgi:hypothetical protein
MQCSAFATIAFVFEILNVEIGVGGFVVDDRLLSIIGRAIVDDDQFFLNIMNKFNRLNFI